MPELSVVVIGKDEGERLKRCLASVRQMTEPAGGLELIYVDSRSIDGSIQLAEQAGARVTILDAKRPTAGAARNAGWHMARAPFILFLDGDCAVDPSFAVRALPEFNDARTAAVFGRVTERHRETLLYDRMMEFDRFNPSPGPAPYCAGISIMRRSVLEAVDGFDPDLIACEEPDLCRRISKLDLLILRIDIPMAEHDLGMQQLSQYCRRAFRMGYGVAEVSSRYPKSQTWDGRAAGVNSTWGAMLFVLLLLSATGIAYWHSWAPAIFTIGLSTAVALAIARKNRRKTNTRATCLLFGFFWVLKQLPSLFGGMAFRIDKLRGRKRGWITCK
jgi:glycosyltransferase involved in cell wall biosynthesis